MLAHIFNIHPLFLILWKKAKKLLSNNQNHEFKGRKIGDIFAPKAINFQLFSKSFLIWILLSNMLHLIYWKPKSENVIFSTLLVAEKVKALYEFWRKNFFLPNFIFYSAMEYYLPLATWKFKKFSKKGPL